MTGMKQFASVFLILSTLALCPLGCTSASDGGVVGSGISSVQGNIVQVEVVPESAVPPAQRTGGDAAGAALPIVLVSIDEKPGIETSTDAEGSFMLDGSFAGTITLRFRDTAGDFTLGTLVVEIGAGATIVLPDIEIRTDLPDDARVQVRPPLQINLFGHVTVRDCADGRLVIEDESAARNHFVLRLRDGTEIVNAGDTGSVSCDSIRVGDRVTVVEGVVDREEGLIETVKLRVLPSDTVPPPTVRVRRRGIVLRTACARGFVHFQDTVPNDLVSAHLTDDTEISCGAESPRRCTCEDIGFGDIIDVVGVRRADAARSIDALRVQVTPNPASSFVTMAQGDVVSIDCTARVLRALVNEISGDAVRPREMDVQLTDDTMYRCFGDLPCACADVRARDRVAVEALVSIDQRTASEALVITVLTAAQLRFAGVIDTVDCGVGSLVIAPDSDPTTRVRLQLTRATQFHLFDGTMTSCRNLVAGGRVGVRGRVERGEPNAPRRNVAELVRLERPRR